MQKLLKLLDASVFEAALGAFAGGYFFVFKQFSLDYHKVLLVDCLAFCFFDAIDQSAQIFKPQRLRLFVDPALELNEMQTTLAR